MKEFIEKLIERLEEIKTYYAEDFSQGYSCEVDCVEKYEVKKIVNQLAEEYKPKTNEDIQEVIDCLEVYTAGRLNTSKVEISVLQLQRYINRLKQISVECYNRWIPCSERLPEIDGNTSDTVLVCTVDGYRHMAFWCDDGKWRYCESGEIKEPIEWVEIIAWQPMPAPFKKKENSMAKCKKCQNIYNLSNKDDVIVGKWCPKINDSPDIERERECEHFKAMTNADKIRSMNDEELAEFFSERDKIPNRYKCKEIEDWVKWLQSEAE